MVRLDHISFTQPRRENEMNITLEQHMRDMGLMEPTQIEEVAAVTDTRHVYLEKGYFNDPRNENGDVPF